MRKIYLHAIWAKVWVVLLLMVSLDTYASSATCAAQRSTQTVGQWLLGCTRNSESIQINWQADEETAWQVVDGALVASMPNTAGALYAGISSVSIGDGLAELLYRQKQPFRIDGDEIVPIAPEDIEKVTGTFYVSIRHAIAEIAQIDGGWRLTLHPAQIDQLENTRIEGALYLHMWRPIAILCESIERLLLLGASFIGPFGALLGFALVIRLLTFPLNRWGSVAQDRFNQTQARMQPELEGVKQNYKGAERSEKIVALYKKHNLKPLTGLKGSVPLLIQLPILIAIFNVTTVSALFQGTPLLWIEDLSLPDRLFSLGLELPILGSGINLLPILLGCVGWLASRVEGSGSSGLFLHGLITLLCYSFSAAVVVYWIVINCIQIFEKKLVRFGSENG